MSWLSTILACAMLAVSVVLLRADPPEKPPEGAGKRKEEKKDLSADDRDTRTKESRKTNGVSSKSEAERRREQFRNMTPEERAAKRKEIKARLEKKIAELRAKQVSATITPQETRELERREKILKHFEQADSNSPRMERPKPVFTNSPIQN